MEGGEWINQYVITAESGEHDLCGHDFIECHKMLKNRANIGLLQHEYPFSGYFFMWGRSDGD